MGRAFAIVAIGAAFLAGLHLGSAIGQPRLVGFGCIGADGPLYADAESDFPRCLNIQPAN